MAPSRVRRFSDLDPTSISIYAGASAQAYVHVAYTASTVAASQGLTHCRLSSAHCSAERQWRRGSRFHRGSTLTRCLHKVVPSAVATVSTVGVTLLQRYSCLLHKNKFTANVPRRARAQVLRHKRMAACTGPAASTALGCLLTGGHRPINIVAARWRMAAPRSMIITAWVVVAARVFPLSRRTRRRGCTPPGVRGRGWILGRGGRGVRGSST